MVIFTKKMNHGLTIKIMQKSFCFSWLPLHILPSVALPRYPIWPRRKGSTGGSSCLRRDQYHSRKVFTKKRTKRVRQIEGQKQGSRQKQAEIHWVSTEIWPNHEICPEKLEMLFKKQPPTLQRSVSSQPSGSMLPTHAQWCSNRSIQTSKTWKHTVPWFFWVRMV
jgi:hypothetical protein